MLTIRKEGLTFYVGERSDLFWRNVRKKKWENHTFRIFQAFIARDGTYLDIGAWIGPTVLFGAQLARHCYAIEPDPVAFRELERNVGLNPELKARITLHNGCLWTHTGSVAFGSRSSFGDSQSSVLFAGGAQQLEVDAVTCEEFLARYQITDCAFIKMDIEGGEAAVLPTMRGFLAQARPALYLSLHPTWFTDRARETEQIVEVLKTYAFLYTRQGHRLTATGLRLLMQEQEFLEVVAAPHPWPWVSRYVNRILCAMKQ